MHDLTAPMKLALKPRTWDDTTSINRQPVQLYEVYPQDYYPGDAGTFNPADALYLFADSPIIWLGLTYEGRVLNRSAIGKHITAEFNGCSVTTNNADKAMSVFAIAHSTDNLRIVIRYIDRALSIVLADSDIMYVGRLADLDSVSSEQAILPSKEDLGSILHEIPRRVFSKDDPIGRAPDDPLFEGIRAVNRTGIGTVTVPVTHSFLLFFHRTRNEQRSVQWSTENDSHEGQAMPWINGRCQMEGTAIAWYDEGVYIHALFVFAGHKVYSLSNFVCQSPGFGISGINPVHLGDPGGTGTNATAEVSFAQIGLLSKTAYVHINSLGSAPDRVDPAPTYSAIVLGETDLPDAGGAFTIKGPSSNPAYIARRTLVDTDAIGLNPAMVNNAQLLETAALCDSLVRDFTNSESLAVTQPLADAMAAGRATRFRSQGLVSSSTYRNLENPGSWADPTLQPIDDPTILDLLDLPSTLPTVPRFRRRFTYNAPLTDKIKAVDFLHNYIFASARLYSKTNQRGQIDVMMERPADASHLLLNSSIGATSVVVADILPWITSKKGEILIGAGLVTSEARTVTTALYHPGIGNAITIAVETTGLATGISVVGGLTALGGGSTTVPSTATVRLATGTTSGERITVIIDGRRVWYTEETSDNLPSAAAMLATAINTDSELQQYITAEWTLATDPNDIRIYSKVGTASFALALANVHTAQIDSPLVAPTLTAAAHTPGLAIGVWEVAYSDQSALGETLISPKASITLTANQQINVAAVGLPAGVASRNWYVSQAPGGTLKFFINNVGTAFSILIPPSSGERTIPQFNDAGEESIRILFNWGPWSIREGTAFQWPLVSQAGAINQVLIKYKSAVDDFAVKEYYANDYAHQVEVGKTNKVEINGAGIDSHYQAVVIANALLARQRDGNFIVKWTVDEAGIPYEEGDVGCVTDDSGLVRQPVRIEHMTIQADLDVEFEARIYSTHMFRDLTGHKSVAISSPLKYLSIPPPAPTSVVLTEQFLAVPGDVWIPVLQGEFTFGTYIGLQTMRVYVKLFGTPDYVLMDQMIPDEVNNGHFGIPGIPRTVVGSPHLVKLVPVGAYGLTTGLAAATAYPVDILPALQTVMKIFDNVIPKDSVSGLGLTFGIAPLAGSGVYFGTTIWRDRGYGYERVATLRSNQQSPMGHTTNNAINWLGDGTGGSYAILWVIKDGNSPNFSNATVGEIGDGKNNFFVGREKLGVQTWTDMGSGLWKGENLVRGLGETWIFQNTHIAQEDVLQLDEGIAFIPIEVRDLTHSLSFKAISIGADVSTGTIVTLTIRGDSTRELPVSNLAGTRDAAGDWHISADSNSLTPNIEHIVRIRRPADSILMRDIPIAAVMSFAAMFPDTYGGIRVDRNSLRALSGSVQGARTVQTLTAPGQFVEFRIPQVVTYGKIVVSLRDAYDSGWYLTQAGGPLDYGYYSIILTPDGLYNWMANVLETGPTIMESVFGTSHVITNATNATPIVITCVSHNFTTNMVVDISGVLGAVNANGPAWVITKIDDDRFSLNASAGSGGAYTGGGSARTANSFLGPGPLSIRIVWSGTEIRFYKNWLHSASLPFVIARRGPAFYEGFAYKVRVVFGGPDPESEQTLNCIMGGLTLPQTIYSGAQQQADNGGNLLTSINVEMWAIGIDGRPGFSVTKTFP